MPTTPKPTGNPNSTAFAVNELYISWRPALPMLYPDRKTFPDISLPVTGDFCKATRTEQVIYCPAWAVSLEPLISRHNRRLGSHKTSGGSWRFGATALISR